MPTLPPAPPPPLTLDDIRDPTGQRLLYYLRQLSSRLIAAESALTSTASASNRLKLTSQDVDHLAATMQRELSAIGAHPLPVEGLQGRTSQAQRAAILIFSTDPTTSVDANLYDVGTMATYSGNFYYVASGNPHTWSTLTLAVAPHNILSATHGDTLAAAVVRGDMMVGNATPKWARVAKGTGNQVWRMDGAGTDPGWGAVADAALSANVALYNAATPIFANTLHFPSSIEDGPSGSTLVEGYNSAEITLSLVGATTDSATNLLPADARIRFVTWRITQTISGGGVTTMQIGDAGTANRFDSTGTLAVGTTGVGLRHMQGSVTTDAAGPVQTAAAKIRITMDGTPTQGKVRVVVYYEQGTAPTS